MNYKISTILALMAALLTVGCVTTKSKDPNAPLGPPDATITFSAGQASYWVGGASGGGKINYKGVIRDFKIVAASAGGSAAQKITGTAEVYNLNTLEDFPGVYNGKKSGFTLFRGKMHSRLENKNGVVIYVEGKTTGLGTSGSLTKVTISLK